MSGPEPSNYFYAEGDPALYDATVELTTEVYWLMHQQVVRLVEIWNRCSRKVERPIVLDVGAGTGAEALGILKAIPDAEVVCVDASASMLELLKSKVTAQFGDESAAGRCNTVVADAYQRGWIAEVFAKLGRVPPRVDLIVSVYLYHHLHSAEKAIVYREIAENLIPGGVFIQGDLFSFSSADLADRARALEEDWLNKSFSNPRMLTRLNISAGDANMLLHNWCNHLRNDNRPLPIDAFDSAPCERGLLEDAGFQLIEVPFRFFQNGIIWAAL